MNHSNERQPSIERTATLGNWLEPPFNRDPFQRVREVVCDVAPEFDGTSLQTATVQHLIDMTAGTGFVEDYDLYLDPEGDSPLIECERQSGCRPLDGRRAIGAAFGTVAAALGA